jgi:hypothetical protein
LGRDEAVVAAPVDKKRIERNATQAPRYGD